jgi:hypothetical protein
VIDRLGARAGVVLSFSAPQPMRSTAITIVGERIIAISSGEMSMQN